MPLTTNSGVNTRPAVPPTVTLNSVAVTWTAAVANRAESLRKSEKRMSSRLREKEKESGSARKEERRVRGTERLPAPSYRWSRQANSDN